MHNFVVDGKLTEPQMHTNMDVLERNCNADFYSVWRDATQLEDAAFGSSATYVTATGSVPAHWELADTVLSGVSFYVRRHPAWLSGGFDIKVHWSTNPKAGDVRWGIDINPVVSGGTFGSFSGAGVTASPAGAADTLTVSTLSSSDLKGICIVDPSHLGYHVLLRRTGNGVADTNTGTVSLYGIELLYVEGRRNTGGTVKL